ncbi:MAG: NAD(P)H-dependent oxidoreductase subunit E [Planctomycetes bacterium]|nr:NAD(P)H-dependent oxidoreductase subunit E [Planctomycetota bacterium]
MAWPTKPSATMQIARRAEPFVTAAMKDRWTREVLPKYATRLGALMPVLHDVQHAYRHIPHQAQLEVAEFLGIAPSDVLDTVSFYDEFTVEQRGVVTIGVCHSVACEQCGCGSTRLIDHARERLGITPGETTDDGRFTLIAMDCLGSCDTAPVALLNETLHENLTVEALDRLIGEARRASPGGHH